jgi:hypothetical protein
MKTRTLVANQLYFGLEPLVLTRGIERTLERFAHVAPENIRVSANILSEAFRLDSVGTARLLQAFVADKVLEPAPGNRREYRITGRFRELAAARVIPPLRRDEAKQLVEQACDFAAQFNAEEIRNPLMIERMAVSGGYMSDSDRIGKLALWPVVTRRDDAAKDAMTREEGARAIRHALRALSPFIAARVVTDIATVERPFSVPFYAEGETSIAPDHSPTTAVREWVGSFRQWLSGW